MIEISSAVSIKSEKGGKQDMCKEYDENREALSELIFELHDFTEEKLIKEFSKRRHGKIEIGQSQTIHGFLDELREFGVLGFEFGRYHVQKRTLALT